MSNAADDFVKSYIEGVHRRCEREASKDRTQEEGNQDQAKNDGQDVGSPVSDNSSNPTTGTSSMATNTNTVSPNTSKQETVASMSTNVGAGTGTKTDESSSTGQEKNKTCTITSGSGTKTDVSSSTGQEKNKTSTITSGSGTKTDASSSTGQEKNKTCTITSGSGTKTDASSSTGQEKNKTCTITSGSGTKTDASSSTREEKNKTSTATSSAGIYANDNPSSSRTSQEQRQIRQSSPEIIEEPPEIAVPASDNSNSESFTLIDTILQEAEIIRSMAVDSDDVLFTGSDIMIRKWHKGQKVLDFLPIIGTCYAIDAKYMPYHEPCVFVAHDKGEITVWASTIDGLLMLRWTLHRPWDCYFPWSDPGRYPISCLCLSDDFNFIYAGSADCTLNTWHARKYDSNPINTIHGHTSAINALAVGLLVVFSGSSDGIIKMWRRETYGRSEGKVRHLSIATFYAYGAVPVSVNALVFCTVDNVHGCLYAGSSDGNVRCWKNLSVNEPDAGNRELEVMSAHSSAVTCLAWCSGPFVFSGSRDKTIRVWRRAENEAVNHTDAMVLRGHTDGITCIAAQNDWEVDNAAGPRQWILYSGSLDFTLRIWRVYEQPRAITGGQKVA